MYDVTKVVTKVVYFELRALNIVSKEVLECVLFYKNKYKILSTFLSTFLAV